MDTEEKCYEINPIEILAVPMSSQNKFWYKNIEKKVDFNQRHLCICKFVQFKLSIPESTKYIETCLYLKSPL